MKSHINIVYLDRVVLFILHYKIGKLRNLRRTKVSKYRFFGNGNEKMLWDLTNGAI